MNDKHILLAPTLCSKCCRINCNGQRHGSDTEFVYPFCHNCGIELCDIIELLANGSTQRSETACEICSKEYLSDSDHQNHFNTHFYCFNQRSEHKFFCISCYETFTQPQRIVDGEITFPCADCNSKYLNDFELNNHRYLSHDVQLPFTILDNDDKEKVQNSVLVDIAKKTAKIEIVEILNHKEEKLPQLNCVYCRFCGSDGPEFACRLERSRHENSVHRSTKTRLYSCLYCSKEFASIGKVETHQSVHTLVVPSNFVCDICGKGFRERGKLNAHLISHTNERPYPCDECGKYYKSAGAVQKHKSHFHSTDRRFKCPMCEKTYRDASDLRRHKWTHGGREKQFVCDVCNLRFYEQKNLNAHAKRHANRCLKRSNINQKPMYTPTKT